MKPNKNVRNFLNSFKQSTISIYMHTYIHTHKHTCVKKLKTYRHVPWLEWYIYKKNQLLQWDGPQFPFSLFLSDSLSLSDSHSLTLSPHFLWCSRSLLCSGARQEERRRLEDDKQPLPPLKWADWASLSPSSGTSQSTGAFSYRLWLRGMVEEEGWVDVAWDSSVASIKLLASRWNRWL